MSSFNLTFSQVSEGIQSSLIKLSMSEKYQIPMAEIGGQKVSVDNCHTEATKNGQLQLDWKSPKLAKLNLEPSSWYWLHCYQDRQRQEDRVDDGCRSLEVDEVDKVLP